MSLQIQIMHCRQFTTVFFQIFKESFSYFIHFYFRKIFFLVSIFFCFHFFLNFRDECQYSSSGFGERAILIFFYFSEAMLAFRIDHPSQIEKYGRGLRDRLGAFQWDWVGVRPCGDHPTPTWFASHVSFAPTLPNEHLQWFGNFGLAFVVVCQLPIANAKEKIWPSPMVWHFGLGNYLVDPTKSFPAFFCRTPLFVRAFLPSREGSRRRSQTFLSVAFIILVRWEEHRLWLVSVSTAMDLIRSCRYLDVICELVPCSQSQVCGHRCCRVSCRRGLGAHAAAGDSIKQTARLFWPLAAETPTTRQLHKKDSVKSNWREDSNRVWKRRQRNLDAYGFGARKPGASECQTRSQLANMPRGASQMPSLLKWQTRLQNRWRSNFYFFTK